jgi:hypothetical protein
MSAWARRLTALLAVGAAAWAGAVATTGGFAISLLSVRVVSRDPWRPAAAAAALAAFGWALSGRAFSQPFDAIGRLVVRAAPLLAIAVAVGSAAAAIGWGTFAASGADSYGYVSQSRLWRDLRLVVEQPFVARVAWPNVDAAFAPLGYRPAADGHAIVPSYPPGLPMAMAAAEVVGGSCGAYFVVPICAAVCAWLTFVLGRRVSSPSAGVFAAVLLATSPVFFYQSLMPMSDVPAAACWTAAIYFGLGSPERADNRAREAAAAGLCAAIAILIRPNLAPLAVAIAPVAATPDPVHGGWSRAARRLFAFAIPIAAALAGLALLYFRLNGSPFRSGYGDIETAFALAHVPVNAARWFSWTVATQTPAMSLALAAIVLPLATPARPLPRRAAALFAAIGVITAAAYVGFVPFDDWSYLRFLLPVFPLAMVAMSAAILWILSPAPSPVRALACAVIVAALCGHGLKFLADAGAASLRDNARRYAAVGRYAARGTPPNAIFISLQHSGSLRHYSGKPTVRFDLVSVGLDRALRDLRQAGWQPFFVLEDWEETQFKQQFAGASEIGRLEFRPIARLVDAGVNIYDPEAAGARERAPIEIPRLSDVTCAEP